jgi:protease-4
MRFVGKVWRLLVGLKDGLVLLLMLLFFGLLYSALSATPRVPAGARGALLLDLDGTIVEEPAPIEPLELLGGGSALVREYRRRDVVASLEAAAEDKRIEAIALDLDVFTGGGQVTLSSVARALDKVRKAGKKVIAYASTYTDDGYQLAAHADEIWLHPLGAVFLRGPGVETLYYKGLMDKLGVTANVYRAGTYKAAVEPFIRNDMSPENREAMTALVGALWENWLDEVGRARPKAQIRDYIARPMPRFEQAGGDMARAALAAGLVDRVGDRTAYGKRLAEIVGTDRDQVPGSFKTIHFYPWIHTNPAGHDDGNVGVLTVAGELVDGEAEAGTAGAETIVRLLHDALEQRDLEALVVRVDSPGGSVYASERVRQAILDAKARGLPVVISMGSVAASGGYWVATAGDQVMAEPSTITGSIGVFGILPSFQGSIEKLGLGVDGVDSTPFTGEPDVLRGPSPEMGALLQMSVDYIYRRFVALVSQARKLPADRVDAIGQGRVWDGGTARQFGLVDRFGSLDDAIAEAARRAKLDPDQVREVYLEREPGFLNSLLASYAEEEQEPQASSNLFSRIAGRPEAVLMRALYDTERLVAGASLQARCLECPPASLSVPSRRREPGLLAGLVALLSP